MFNTNTVSKRRLRTPASLCSASMMLQRWRAADTSHVFFHSSALRVFDRVDLSLLYTTATGVKWRFFIHTGAKSSHHLCSDVSVTCRTLSRTAVLLLFAFRCFWQRLRLHARRAKHTIHLPFGPLDAEECANTSPPRSSFTGQTPLTGRVLNNPGIPECYIYLLDYTQIKRKVV